MCTSDFSIREKSVEGCDVLNQRKRAGCSSFFFFFVGISEYKVEKYAESSVSAQNMSNIYTQFSYVPYNTL